MNTNRRRTIGEIYAYTWHMCLFWRCVLGHLCARVAKNKKEKCTHTNMREMVIIRFFWFRFQIQVALAGLLFCDCGYAIPTSESSLWLKLVSLLHKLRMYAGAAVMVSSTFSCTLPIRAREKNKTRAQNQIAIHITARFVAYESFVWRWCHTHAHTHSNVCACAWVCACV